MVAVETAAVSAAVSGMLKLVVNKLAPLAIKEYSSIVGVKEDLQELQDLAQEINSQLEAAGDRDVGDAPSLKRLKAVVYEVDDAVDEFQLKAEKYEADGEGGFVSRYLQTKPKSFLFQCQAARKIKKIKKTFDVLVKQRTILNSVVGNDPVSHIKDTAVNVQTLPFVDGAAIIGRDQEMNQIISELLKGDDQQGINIVSIVGLGGSGKTTLAQLVFKEIETIENNNFTVKLWVHVSQEKFQLEKILKKLFESISNERSEGFSLMSMANKILDKLTNKKFLLVLDDVWVEDRNKWQQFGVYFKNGSPGSSILLTTRSRNVATTVESTAIIDLTLLSADHSWQVFQQSFGNAVKDLDSEFKEVGKEIVNKCGGVPLAIKVLAGVLRDKKRVEQWHAIKNNNLLDVDDKERQVSACLWLSYFNLPSHLKQCFTICSIFPKGHWMDKDQLIDQWIAHDMIPEGSGNYLEYITGNDYFSHLVQMGFIQDVEEAEYDGRVKCKMHDLVHDLAWSILGDEISSDVPRVPSTNFTKAYRYFSVMGDTRHLPPENTFRKARAMYIAGEDDFISGKALKKAKHLRSITVEKVHTTALTAILQTKNLRYLNISGLEYYETLPEVISDIWSLQALHVTLSYSLVKLPESIGKLKKLRVVNLSYCRSLTSLPDSIGNCVMISHIDLFGCKKVTTLPSSISRNNRLRVLRLCWTEIERLPSGINELENLECLDLAWCTTLVELPEGIGNLKKLVVLNLQGCCTLKAIPKGVGQLTRLEKLGLFVIGEDGNCAQVSELENVNKIRGELIIHGIRNGIQPNIAHKEWLKEKTNLQSLTLVCASTVGVNSENQLEGLEPPSGIKSLTIDKYPGHKSMQWMLKHIDAEVAHLPRFQLLSELELSEFPQLERLEGLTELPCLEKLELYGMPALKMISGGPFPSLVELHLKEMPSLGVVWMATEGILDDVEGGQLKIGNHLSALRIFGCPKLMVMPYFPSSLKDLVLNKSNVQLLGLPGLNQRSSLPSRSAGLPYFSLSCLKNLILSAMPPPPSAVAAAEPSYTPGSRWELLQHLTALESLDIWNCNGLFELPESIRGLSCLRTLRIYSCNDLCMLPVWLGELQYLEKMDINRCCSLSPAPHLLMQPLRALKTLSIYDSGRVGGLCSPSLQTLQIGGLLQLFTQLPSLANLEISRCPDFRYLSACVVELCSLQKLSFLSLPSFRSLPRSLRDLKSLSLQEIRIQGCDPLDHIPDFVGELCCLREFSILQLPSLTCLPQSLGNLTSLEHLRIIDCGGLTQLPECIGELCSLSRLNIWQLPSLTLLPQSLGRLTTLKVLIIRDCKALDQLPESLGKLRSLTTFEMSELPGLTSIPESMCGLTSLEELHIRVCPGIRSLPECIKGLSALQTLLIFGCPDLERRCERRKGKDWHLISHIPHLEI